MVDVHILTHLCRIIGLDAILVVQAFACEFVDLVVVCNRF